MSKKRKHEHVDDATALKKPKTEEAEPPVKGGDVSLTTVIASALPAGMTSAQLADLFSAIGPIRSAFVAKDKDESSKGYGFVRFVMTDDARQALQQLNHSKQGGSKIKVDWARRRHREAEKGTEEQEDDKESVKEKPKWPGPKEQQRVRATEHEISADATRTVLVRGLGRSSTATGGGDDELKKALYKKAKKLMAKTLGGADISVEWPLQSEGESVAHIVVPDARTAQVLAAQLNNHIFKSQLLHCCQLFERKAVARKGRARGGGRLIVRNLAWDVLPADLAAVFAAYGPLHSVDIPRKADAPDRARGFAFVWMLRRPDAEKAIAGINGTEISPGYAAQRVAEGADNRKKSEKRKASESSAKASGRVVAVDWALSKDQWEASNVKTEDVKKEEEVKAEEELEDIYGRAPGEESDGYLSEELSDSDESMFGDHEDTESETAGSLDDDLENALSQENTAAKSSSADKGKAVAEGMTLFMRNIQFEATEDELFAVCKRFGPVQYARITKDPKTGRSRGTGFVHFYKAADAQRLLEESETLHQQDQHSAAANPFSQPSLLQADPSSSAARALSLHGRVLSVSKAVSRHEAEDLREAREKANEKKDRRNLYLMREGVIVPDSPAAKKLHRADLEARQSSYDARKALLRSNPSLYVSRTRLSVRQIPLFVNDRLLRKMALYALKAYDSDVKAGKQPAMTADEMTTDPGEVLGVVKPKLLKAGKPPPSRVRQAKISRQSDRIDALTGEGRSKGYGFLEMASHADALRVLRWANANRSAGALFRGWWRDELTSQLASAEKMPLGADRDARKDRLQAKAAELEAETQRAEAKAAARGTTLEGLEARAARTLIIELSIENAVTVKRRQEKTERSRISAVKRKHSGRLDSAAEEQPEAPGGPRTAKRQRPNTTASRTHRPEAEYTAQETPVKAMGSALGSTIGRKRRERKLKRAGKS